MKTVFEHIRSRLYDQAGLSRPASIGTTAEIEKDIQGKWAELDSVVKLAKNRLVVGTCRYGLGKGNCHDFYDYGKEAAKRIQRYFDTKNLENLVDALNFCALEFNHPHIQGAHFTAIDDGEHSERIK